MKNRTQRNRVGTTAMKFSGRFISITRKFIFSLLLLLPLMSNRTSAQSCLTNSLVINTGYDPTTGGTTPTPGTDMHWKVTALPPATPPAACSLVILGGSADLVTPPWFWVAGNWISCLNSNYYGTDGSGTIYNMTLSRPFNMCSDDTVSFILNVAVDNSISQIYIDGGAIVFPWSQPFGDILPHFEGITTIPVFTTHLCAGSHTLNFVVNNFNFTTPDAVNPTGLSVWGTINSTNNSIVSESAACTGYACPAISAGAIEGPPSLCAGDNASYIDPTGTPGGTWSVTPSGAYAIDPLTGELTTDPTASGIITITYTPSGCSAVSASINVTIYPSPAFTLAIIPAQPAYCTGDWITITSTITPSCPSCTYNWGPSPWTSTGPDLTRLLASTGWASMYNSLTVTNSFGCSTTENAFFEVYPRPHPVITWQPQPLCCDDIVYLQNTGSTGMGWPGTTEAWSILGGVGPGNTIDPVTGTTVDPVTGVVHIGCLSATSVTILYTITNLGCFETASIVLTIIAPPVVAPITGPVTVCEGSTITLTDVTPGGFWSCTPTTTATIDAFGVLTPVPGGPGGIVTVSYTVPGVKCPTTVTYTVTVGPVMHACVIDSWGLDSAGVATNHLFIFTATGPAGAITSGVSITWLGLDCSGLVVYGPSTHTGTFPYTVDWAVLPGVCQVCVTSITDLASGCIWPANCCASIFRYDREAGGSPSGVTNTMATSDKLSVIPNPNKGSFTLSGTVANASNLKDIDFEVVDMLGQVMYKDVAKIDNGEINKNITLGDNIANGVYLIRIKGEGENRTIRFTLDR